ncbi:uncharacterized protein [Macrobrachium rosenbergii]|uniref:uncharacterized protein n=1 Tax=Macrobrachium rosenbergii TaxID=79674 RepID=UPI0034D67F8E
MCLQPPPKYRSVIGGRWVYTKETSLDNSTRYKARYVAKGFSQEKGVDFTETFSPTVKFTSVRMLIQVAVQKDMLVHQMDVKTASLNSDIACEIFLEQPEGFVKTNIKELTDPKECRDIVGRLIYAMTGTRPDLCYVVTKLSQFMFKPTKAHLSIPKHVLKYVKGSLDSNLKFNKSNKPLKLIGYRDSDWANFGDRRSISGYGFLINNGGGLASWKSKKQRAVALSTCKADYMAISYAMQEANFSWHAIRRIV